jgi:glycosyltransferase involved in cell wall biosynthesis
MGLLWHNRQVAGCRALEIAPAVLVKALVIAPQPFFSPRGTPFSVYYRTLVMSEIGVDVDLLTYGQGQDVDLPGVRLIRIPNIPGFGEVKTGPSAFKLLLDVLMSLWTVGLLLRHRYDFVHAHEEAVFICRFLKPVFRFKLLYDMHSSLPQQLDNFEFTKSRTIKALFEQLERTSLRAADAVITICPDLADYVVSEIGDDPKHELIENSIFEPVRLLGTRTGQSGEDEGLVDLPPARRVIIYAGTFEKYQGLDILIPAFALARQKAPDALLLMVGGNPHQVEELKQLAVQSGVGNDVVFTGRVSQSRAKAYNARADLLTSPRSSGTNTPLKLYEQLASGKPLVATRIHSHTQVLDDSVAYLVDPTVADLAAGLVLAMAEPEVAERKARAAQVLYDAKYSRPVYEAKMRKLLRHLAPAPTLRSRTSG